MNMNRWLGLALALSAVSATAATLEEDEARIDALIRAERAARAHGAAPRGVAGTQAAGTQRDDVQAEPDVPVAAAVVAPPATPHDDWLAVPDRGAGLSFAELAGHVGERVTIVTSNDRVHRGVINSADERQVTLRVSRRGGNATYTLSRAQVLRVDAH
ncbi:hypothetical protein [Dokdonella sp.]|uniref:hypothetical protein n=1 Tax=Dokdonella sp. TaxID=2291710 RepID=UPI00261B6679|nr:hypothetical protein [Dokdonella sp.]